MTLRARRVLSRITLAAGAALATLICVEILVRAIAPQQDAEMWFESSKRYGHIMKPYFHQVYRYPQARVAFQVNTNSFGLRGPEYDLKQLGIKRVLLLGDSFTFGYGLDVEEIFASKLEKLLNKAGNQYLVINAGVGGWGTLQETSYARDHFGLFRPDIVVLTFCGNDPTDDDLFRRGKVDNARGCVNVPGKIFLRNNSHVYRLVYHSVMKITHRWRLRSKVRDHPDIPLDGQSATVISEEEWKSSLGIIRGFHEDFVRFNPRGILLVQTTYPNNVNIREHLRTLENGKNLFYVDLYDAVRDLGVERMRLSYDGHWTREMHLLSAQGLFRAISGLVEQTTRGAGIGFSGGA